MNSYYLDLNADAKGEHTVHISTCLYLPDLSHLLHLGYFSNCKEVMEAAEKYFPKINGCKHCCQKIHDDHFIVIG